MRSPVAMSNGCAPVLASYSAITLFTSSMSAVAGSYSSSVVSPREENVTTLAFIFGLLGSIHFGFLWKRSWGVPAPILHRFPELSRWSFVCQLGMALFIGLAACGTRNMRR